nr:putative replication associated protein [Crucivirus sp.]
MSCCVDYEFRLSETATTGTKCTVERLTDALLKIAKNFVFQLEQGEGGYRHFQGSIRLYKKVLPTGALELFKSNLSSNLAECPQYLKPSVKGIHTAHKFNYDCYASKAQTRLGETITDKTAREIKLIEPEYIPRQYRGKIDTLYEYQKTILIMSEDFNTRRINVIIDNIGNNGKSTIAHVARLYKGAVVLPPINDSKELMQACCDILKARGTRKSVPIFVDLPRGMNKKNTQAIYIALEQILSGWLYDIRHNMKEWDIDTPSIWVFTNSEPDLSCVSRDRWALWRISDSKELKPYTTEQTSDDEEIILKPIIAKPIRDLNKRLEVERREAEIKRLNFELQDMKSEIINPDDIYNSDTD